MPDCRLWAGCRTRRVKFKGSEFEVEGGKGILVVMDRKGRRIVIASVLKPVDDTRMFEKFGLSLSKVGHDVHIIGYPGAEAAEHREVTMHPMGSYERLSLKRLLAKWKILRRVMALRPSLFIIATHELLLPAAIVRLMTGAKIVYDVQENYAFNIRHTQAFPRISRGLLASYVRAKERFYGNFVDHFFLAEHSYNSELPFIAKDFTVLENKVRQAAIRIRHRRNDRRLILVFTGTLDENTGVFDAISFAEKLYRHDQRVALRIVGYSANTKMQSRLFSAVEGKPFISVVGGNALVPHPVIMMEIANADFGIIAYHLNPVTQRKTPTKLYEYIGSQLPILLLSENSLWMEVIERYDAGVAAYDLPADAILQLASHSFYGSVKDGIYWEEEKFKLISAVQRLS
jgi:glycosyltransferase involved in cell wall biosynthesis